MRKLRRWVVLGVLLLALGTAAAGAGAADRDERGRGNRPADETPSKWGWINPANWFGGKEKEKAADAKAKKAAKKESATKVDAAVPPSAADEARSRRAREEADLWRRLSVCQQLREIALRNDDHAMLRRVDDLEDRAFTLYTQRTGARIPAPGVDLDPDLQKLDRLRDAETALRPRPEHGPVYSVTSGGTDPHAGVKEVDR